MGKREYTAIFAIGGKLLGSFKGSMAQAEARLAKLKASMIGVGKSIKTIAASFSALGLTIAGLGIGKIIASLFSGASEQAKEARMRINATIASFMQLEEIRAKGTDEAQRQLDIIYKQNEALGKTGVLHSDIYNEMTKQLAAGGVPPRQIKAAMKPLGDLLVKSRGVNATEQDAAELANAYVKAVHGKTRAMQQFSVFVDAGTGKNKKTMQGLFEEILNIAKGYEGFNEQQALTPEGKLQAMQNRLQDIREQLGYKLLPLQVKWAEFQMKMLPKIVPLLDKFLDKLLQIVNAVQKSGHGKLLLGLALGLGALLIILPPLAAAFSAVVTIVTLLATPVGLIIAAIVVLVGLIAWAIINWEGFKNAVNSAAEALGRIPLIGPLLKATFLPLQLLIKGIDWLIHLNWGKIGKTIGDVFIKLGNVILNALLAPINKIIDAINTMINAANKLNPFGKKIPLVPNVGAAFGGGGPGALTAKAAAGVAPAGMAMKGAAMSPAGLKAVQDERADIIKELQQPGIQNLISATLATEAENAEDQKNVLEAAVNRGAAMKRAGTYKGMEALITGGFYGPYNRGETQAVMAKGLSTARAAQVAGMISEIGAGRNVLRGMTDQGMKNEIKGYAEQVGEDYYGFMKGLPEQFETAAYKAPGMQFGGIVRKPLFAQLGERGAEAVLPLGSRILSSLGLTGTGDTNMHFAPNITVNGNMGEAEQAALDGRLRSLARDFIDQFKSAQYQERRLSYESGYG